jgi:hypothetical protein
VDGGVDVKGALQDLAGTGVDHGPLLFCVSNLLSGKEGLGRDIPEWELIQAPKR